MMLGRLHREEGYTAKALYTLHLPVSSIQMRSREALDEDLVMRYVLQCIFTNPLFKMWLRIPRVGAGYEVQKRGAFSPEECVDAEEYENAVSKLEWKVGDQVGGFVIEERDRANGFGEEVRFTTQRMKGGGWPFETTTCVTAKRVEARRSRLPGGAENSAFQVGEPCIEVGIGRAIRWKGGDQSRDRILMRSPDGFFRSSSNRARPAWVGFGETLSLVFQDVISRLILAITAQSATRTRELLTTTGKEAAGASARKLGDCDSAA